MKPKTRRPASLSLTFLRSTRQTKQSLKADKFDEGDSEAGIKDFMILVHESH